MAIDKLFFRDDQMPIRANFQRIFPTLYLRQCSDWIGWDLGLKGKKKKTGFGCDLAAGFGCSECQTGPD